MTLDYYRIFYYAARYKSFTKAAEVLHNNQPNISRFINLLEAELNCRLFIRSNKGLILTPEGESLYKHVSIAMTQLQDGADEIAGMKSLNGGTITIGVSEIALRLFLLKNLENFMNIYPNVKIRLSNYSTPQAIDALEKGMVDFAIVTTPLNIHKPLFSDVLYTFNEILTGGSKYTELALSINCLNDIKSFPFISLMEKTATYELYSNFFFNNNLKFEPDMFAATTDQILPVVSSNLALGFYPEELAMPHIERGEICQIKIKEKIPKRNIVLVRNPSIPESIAAKKFLAQF